MSTTISYRDLKAARVVETISASKTLDASDSGKVFLIATDALAITLPATIEGWYASFYMTGADGAAIITLSPAAADGIAGTVTLAASVVQMDGTVDKDFILTKATGLKGDGCTIVGTGVTGTSAYVIESSTGIWAQGA